MGAASGVSFARPSANQRYDTGSRTSSFGGGTTFDDFEHAVGHPNKVLGVSGALLGDVFGIEADFGVAPGFFERGQDIASHEVLAQIAEECQLEAKTRDAFADRAAARDDVSAEEQRMRGLGISGVPSLLINGRVLVPGPADVDTYVQALDQALFPELPAGPNRRRLH